MTTDTRCAPPGSGCPVAAGAVPERRGTGAAGDPSATAAARRRDRRVYLAAHPVLFALLAASRRGPVVRLGRSVLVHDAGAFREALTRVPLDREATGTTGRAARSALGRVRWVGTGPAAPGTAPRRVVASPKDAQSEGDAPPCDLPHQTPQDPHRPTGHALVRADAPVGGVLFDQQGAGHRAARRALADDLSSAGVERLRPVWNAVLARRLAPLAAGRAVDLVPVAREVAGATAAALLGADADPLALAEAAGGAAYAAVLDHLPGPPRFRRRATDEPVARLRALLGDGGTGGDDAARAMLAVAAVTTVVAALPRAAAWCADAAWWDRAAAEGGRTVLVDELLRVTAPSPVLPRVAAGSGVVGGRPVRAGDRLLLVARHAVGAHRDDPDPWRPAEPAVSQLVFGAGPHACPGARLARAQLHDALGALAPYRPVVVRARADRRAALPGWRSLVVRAGEET
ncbi:cytochrome P450 [Streptomyces triculaminicus]|uniref:cytochrome P450 n=1 Tax=Streptomyces triculaminicus TaxID=2816232 RepID=UPI0034103287